MNRREEILKEVKKYSKENTGKTPSEKVFYEYSGLNVYDIKKFGWANYGELISEAGLTPNKFDKTKYSHDQLCDIFIEIIREKNKWPSRGDIEVRHFKDPSIPHPGTFYKKLGLTNNLAQSILAYIFDKNGYDDVYKICKNISDASEPVAKENDESKMTGYVYLGIQNNIHKIGFAKDLDRRREDITLMGPTPMVWIHSIKTDDMVGVEKYWHNRFKSKNTRAEWFKLAPSDVKAFKRWKKIY